jgi:hypothetical protein
MIFCIKNIFKIIDTANAGTQYLQKQIQRHPSAPCPERVQAQSLPGITQEEIA